MSSHRHTAAATRGDAPKAALRLGLRALDEINDMRTAIAERQREIEAVGAEVAEMRGGMDRRSTQANRTHSSASWSPVSRAAPQRRWRSRSRPARSCAQHSPRSGGAWTRRRRRQRHYRLR